MMKKLLSLILVTSVLAGASPVFAEIISGKDTHISQSDQLSIDANNTLYDTIFNAVDGGIGGDDVEAILNTTGTLIGTAAAIATGKYYDLQIPPSTLTSKIETSGKVSVTFNGMLTGILATHPHVAIVFGDSPVSMKRVRALYSSNKDLNVGAVATFSKEVRGFDQGTTYYFYPLDADHNIAYPVQSFKTPGTAPTGKSSSVEAGHTVLMADGASFAIEVWGTKGANNTELVLKGKVIPLRKQGINLKIGYGTSSSNLAPTDTVLTRSMLNIGDDSRDAATRSKLEFTYTFKNLVVDTQYYFQLTDIAHNIKYPIKSFTITDKKSPDSTALNNDTEDLVSAVIDDTINIENPYAGKGLVPCGGKGQEMCTFRDFLQLVGNIIDYIFILIIPITAAMCVYTGFSLIINRKKSDELTLAKSRLLKLGIGLAVIFLAFAGIASLYKALGISGDYILLDVLGTKEETTDTTTPPGKTTTAQSCSTTTISTALSSGGYTQSTKMSTLISEQVDANFQGISTGFLVTNGLTGNSTVGQFMTKFGLTGNETITQAGTKANIPSALMKALCP